MRGVSERRAEAGVGEGDQAAEAALDPLLVGLVELLDRVELAALARRAREAVDRVAVVEDRERLAEEYQRLLGDVDHALPPLRPGDVAAGRTAQVDQEGDGDVAALLAHAGIGALGGRQAEAAV